MARSLTNAMYPSTTYRHNSGGDPAEIPMLTYGQLKSFHQRFYHPSNAFFYTYGNLPLKDHLHFIQDKVLCRFERIDPKTDVPLQTRWDQPRTATYRYPLGKTEDVFSAKQIEKTFGIKTFTGKVGQENFFLPLGEFAKDNPATINPQ